MSLRAPAHGRNELRMRKLRPAILVGLAAAALATAAHAEPGTHNRLAAIAGQASSVEWLASAAANRPRVDAATKAYVARMQHGYVPLIALFRDAAQHCYFQEDVRRLLRDQVGPDSAAWSSASTSPRERVTAAVRLDTPSLA